jgi:hypothetical protein
MNEGIIKAFAGSTTLGLAGAENGMGHFRRLEAFQQYFPLFCDTLGVSHYNRKHC